MAKVKDFYSGYDQEKVEGVAESSFADTEREYPIESRCCISGDEVKHSFCRYPDTARGTMMVMTRETMIRLSRNGGSLADKFESVISLRRKQEGRS